MELSTVTNVSARPVGEIRDRAKAGAALTGSQRKVVVLIEREPCPQVMKLK
jgi:hypothetical protein